MKLSTYDGDKPYIFISYAHKDAEQVLPVLEGLQRSGFRIWFDQGIEAGTEWPEYIAEHLEKATRVIVFMSEAAAASKNCRREINYSIEIDKEPLVVYLEQVNLTGGLRLQLNTLQAIFKYHSNNNMEFIEALCNAKILQCCRETQNVAPAPVVGHATKSMPEAAHTYVNNNVRYTPSSTVQSPYPESMPVQNTFEEKKKKSKKGVRIAIIFLVIVVIFVSVSLIAYSLSVSSTKLEYFDAETNSQLELVLHYKESTGVVTKVELSRIVELDYDMVGLSSQDEIEKLMDNARNELKEEVKGMSFASTDAYMEGNSLYVKYIFDDLDNNDNAKALAEDFFGTDVYSPKYDEGDYRMYYETMIDALKSEGFKIVD